jgi:hypothetical protein
MKHALERYNHLVMVQLTAMSGNHENFTDDILSEWIEVSVKEKENIRRYLLKKSLHIKTEKEFELLIQQYQAEIIQLLDVAFKGKLENLLEPHGRLYNVILKDLEEILTHIENRYTKYFSLEEKVPASYFQASQPDLKRRVNELREFSTRVLANNKLIKIVFNPLDAFLNLEEKVSYRQLMYVKDLVSEMEAWASESEASTSFKSFLSLLLYMNFNAVKVVSFLMQEIADSTNALPEQNQRVERLAEYLKQCNQTQIKPGVSFRYNLHPLRDQLSEWIEEEMVYLEKQQRLFSVVPAHVDEVIADKEKLQVSFSVDVFSLFIRSAKDSKMILNKEMKGIFRIVSKFVRTGKVDNPSAKSMFNKSYVADRNAKETAINLLHEMINHIRKY